MTTDILTLKNIGIAGFSLYVIKQLIFIIIVLINKRKESRYEEAEQTLKRESREKICSTNKKVTAMCNQMHTSVEHFYQMKNKTDDIHDVVTEKKEGVPLVYNKDLERSIDRLNISITNLAGAIKDLKVK